MKKEQSKKGYTLIELLIVIAIVSILAFWLIAIPVSIRGNFWWTGQGVLSQLQEERPAVTKILNSKSQRNIFGYSKITALENSREKLYCLDTNILFDYKIAECK